MQCELARLPECTVPHFQMKPCRRFIRDTADKPWCVGCREQTDRGNALRRRERELWDFGLYAVFKRDVPSGVHVLLPGWTSGRPIESYVRRGFVASIRCDLESWLRIGRAVVAGHPVEDVLISGREPMEVFSGVWCWGRSYTDVLEEHHRLPERIFDRLSPIASQVERVDFADRESAVAAANSAVLEWAKSPEISRNEQAASNV